MSQTESIRAHLEAGKTLTALEAFELFNCFRLAARISELREEGLPVTAEMVRLRRKGPQVARYRLASAEAQLPLI